LAFSFFISILIFRFPFGFLFLATVLKDMYVCTYVSKSRYVSREESNRIESSRVESCRVESHPLPHRSAGGLHKSKSCHCNWN